MVLQSAWRDARAPSDATRGRVGVAASSSAVRVVARRSAWVRRLRFSAETGVEAIFLSIAPWSSAPSGIAGQTCHTTGL
jgi:hypothetical protein